MARKYRLLILIVTLILGAVIGCTNLIAPIHEYFHLRAATKEGVQARISGWSSTLISQLSLKSLLAGYSGMQWLMIWLAPICALVGRKWPWLTGGFPIGYQVANYVAARTSEDFTGGLRFLVETTSFPQNVTKEYALAQFSEYLNGYWNRLCIIGLMVTIPIVLICLAARKKEKAPV